MIEVTYVDHMGTDLTVANAARRSHGVEHQELTWEPKNSRSRSDVQLIRDLVRDGHTLPFRHPHIEVACRSPVPIARQLGKHQVGFTWSEVSRRYKKRDITFHWMDGQWRADVKDRRQGSGDLLPDGVQDKLSLIQSRNVRNALNDFEEAMALGACLEQARMLLPQSMDVLWTWTGSLLGYAELYRKRTHQDAQKETRDFVEKAAKIIDPLFPVSWRALTEIEP